MKTHNLKWFVFVAFTIASSMLLASATASPPHIQPQPCQSGYFRADIRAYGQRLELGIDPKTHLSNVITVTQNDMDANPPDRRYVVLSACLRPLTNAENQALFNQGAK